MALRTSLINGKNLARDNDFGEILGSIFQSGAVVSGLEVKGTGVVSAGTAFIRCVRTATTPNEILWVIVKNPSDISLSVAGTKKVWLEIPIANINNPLINTDEGGLGIAELKTGDVFPGANYVPLASITDGVITDARVYLKQKPTPRDGLQSHSIIYTDSSGEEKMLALGANSTVLFSNGTNMAPSFLPISSLGMTGELKIWTTGTPPTGWLVCDGSAISRSTYAGLFGVIGTTYGAGNGSTTFNLPDTRGKVIAGYDATQTEFNALGKTWGEKTHTLTEAEMPAHYHTYTETYNTATWPIEWAQWPYSQGYRTSNTSTTGSGSAHNNLQPYNTMNYIIKT